MTSQKIEIKDKEIRCPFCRNDLLDERTAAPDFKYLSCPKCGAQSPRFFTQREVNGPWRMRWFHCEEKMPQKGEPVLAKIKASGEVVAAYIVGDMWIEQHISYKPTEMFSTYRFEICRVGDGVITEWMEMPR